MDDFIVFFIENPLLLVVGLILLVIVVFFVLAKGGYLKVGYFSIGGCQPKKEVSIGNELSEIGNNGDAVAPSVPICKIPNAFFKQDKITLRLGRVSNLFESERDWLVLKDLSRKPRKDIYSSAKDVDFALIEFRGIVHARGSVGTYKDKNCSYWLPVIEGDGVEDCCVSSFSHWTKECAFFWVEHIDTHNCEAIVNVMWFKKK